MATNTEKIVIQVQVKGLKDVNKLESGMKKSTKATGGLTRSMIKMGAAIGSALIIFRQLNKTIGGAIRTWKDFEFQMAKVKATTGATDKDFKKLTNTAKQLGRTTFFTASQVGALQMNFAKLGFTTSEILDAQEATLRLATATGSDLARAAIVAGAAVRGFGLDASETERVVDVMAVAFTSSALDIEKWQTSMTKVAPIASGAGVSIEMTAAIMGKLTDAGIEASIAGTSMRNIFLKMQDSSSDLSKHLGFSVKSTEDLERALIQLNSEGLSNEEIMGLVDLRQVAAFATMVNGTDTILEMVIALERANGAAQEMADIMGDTLEGDIITSKSAWEGFQIAIMSGSSKISNFLRKTVQTWTFTLNQWTDSLKSTEDVAIDIFTDVMRTAKEEMKRFNKDFGNMGIATTFSKQLEEEVSLLTGGLESLERLASDSLFKIKNLTKEGRLGGAQVNLEAINEEQKIYEKRIQQFEATKLAIIDLTEEIEIQKEKEVTAAEGAVLKEFQAAQQLIRDKEKAERDRKNKADKLAKEKLAKERKDFQDKKAAINIEYQELENVHKEALINKEITQETYDEAIFDMEQQRLKDMEDLNIAYEESVANIQGQILDNELARIAAVAAAEKKAFDEKKILDDKDIERRKANQAAAIQVGQELSDALFSIDDQNRNRRQSQELKMLEERKESGVITQEKYEEEVEKINRAAFIREKQANIAQALMNGALAITKIFATAIPPVSFMMVAPTIAATAAQLAVISNQKYADGGMVYGNSHEQGGEKFGVGGRVVELEGGESVINKRSTAMYRPLLSSINSMGGGVKFADGGLLNQPSFAQSQFNALGQAGMMGAISQGNQVVVVESDITNSQNTVSTIQSQASF